MKLASNRKRPRRVARKLWARFGIAHYRDVPRGWHCPDCLPVFDLDDEQHEALTRCMSHSGVTIRVSLTGDLASLDDPPDEPAEAPAPTVYQREWRAIRDELGGTAEGQSLAIRLGLELLDEMTGDPIYRAEREHRNRVVEYKREQQERRQLLEMSAGDRLTHALHKGETTVNLTPDQSRPWIGYRRIEVAAPRDPAPFVLDAGALRVCSLHDDAKTWDLAWYTDGSSVASLRR